MSIVALNKLFDTLLEVADPNTVFLACLVEKFIPVLPSYVLFPAIGMGASDINDLVLRCLVATLGSVGGAIGWYSAGAWIGEKRVRHLIERYGKWILLRPQLYDRMSGSYRNNAFRITLLGQMVPTVRIFQALPVGVLRLPLGNFVAATAVGAQCWIAPLAGARYVLRRHGWSALEIWAGLFAVLLAVEAVVFLVLFATAIKRGRNTTLRKTAASETGLIR